MSNWVQRHLAKNISGRLVRQTFLLTFLALLLLGSSARAGGNLTSVVGNLTAHTLTITGTGLPTDKKAETILQAVSQGWSDEDAESLIADGFEYLMTVQVSSTELPAGLSQLEVKSNRMMS